MSDLIFPTASLKGLTFSSFKTPTWGRRIQRSVSGRESVSQDYANPVWMFKLRFDFLRDYSVLMAYSELRVLMNFYNAMQAIGDTFLYTDREDYLATDELLGTGDAAACQFQLVRRLIPNGFAESIIAPAIIDSVTVSGLTMVEGVDFLTDYHTGIITFVTPPNVGAPIVATFRFYFRVRFVDDAVEFERMYHQIWAVKELRFRSVVL